MIFGHAQYLNYPSVSFSQPHVTLQSADLIFKHTRISHIILTSTAYEITKYRTSPLKMGVPIHQVRDFALCTH